MNVQHFDYLDGWRGLAIVFLLIGHFYPVPGINLGTLGVNLFFVLSGLLMSKLLFVKEVPIPVFYRRRISRIFPAFFVMLAVTGHNSVVKSSISECGFIQKCPRMGSLLRHFFYCYLKIAKSQASRYWRTRH